MIFGRKNAQKTNKKKRNTHAVPRDQNNEERSFSIRDCSKAQKNCLPRRKRAREWGRKGEANAKQCANKNVSLLALLLRF